MRKSIAVLTVLCGLSALASTAHATPISGCTQNPGTGQLTCDLYESDANGNPSEIGTVSPGFNAGWLVGYAFMLDAADPTQKANVSDVIIVHSDHIDLFSQGAGAAFDTAYNAALAGAAIDGTAIATGQVFGDTGAGPGGANRQFNPGNGKIGLFWELSDPVVGLSFTADGFFDIINLHSDADFNRQAPVPEPATLSLVALGGAVAAYRKRRQSQKSKNV
jgi:hypothetical protein